MKSEDRTISSAQLPVPGAACRQGDERDADENENPGMGGGHTDNESSEWDGNRDDTGHEEEPCDPPAEYCSVTLHFSTLVMRTRSSFQGGRLSLPSSQSSPEPSLPLPVLSAPSCLSRCARWCRTARRRCRASPRASPGAGKAASAGDRRDDHRDRLRVFNRRRHHVVLAVQDLPHRLAQDLARPGLR